MACFYTIDVKSEPKLILCIFLVERVRVACISVQQQSEWNIGWWNGSG